MANVCFSQFHALSLINVRTNLASHLEFSRFHPRFHYSYGCDSSTKTRYRFACFAMLALTSFPS